MNAIVEAARKRVFWPRFEPFDHPRYRYITLEPYFITLEHSSFLPEPVSIGEWVSIWSTGGAEIMKISAGYAWNGPNRPSLKTYNLMRASLVHDPLVQFMAADILPIKPWKLHADREYRRVSVEDGVHPFRAWYQYHGVRLFGGATHEYEPPK